MQQDSYPIHPSIALEKLHALLPPLQQNGKNLIEEVLYIKPYNKSGENVIQRMMENFY